MKKFLRQLFLIPVYLYKGLISPFGGPCCRYTPSCSSYMVEAVMKHGIFRGFILGMARLFRCRSAFLGGPDPVPEQFSWDGIKADYRRYRKPRDWDSPESDN